MSIISGPNVVNDGLILKLDAGNPKSFRGEPTTNYLYNWMDGTFTGWGSWGDGGGSGSYDLLSDSTYGYKVRFSNTANTGRYSLATVETVNPLAKRTFSMYVKPISWNDSNSRLHIYCDYVGGNGPYYVTGMLFYLGNKTTTGYNYVENSFSYAVGDGWYRIGFTTTFTDATSGGIYPLLYDSSVVELSHPQLEIKNYVTPFVDGTRGNSYATGGGWLDLSGNNNHGELNGNTFNSENMGSLTFNTTNYAGNYINLGMSNISYTKSTISFWVNFYSITGESGNSAMIFGSLYWADNEFSITQHASTYAVMYTVGVNNYAFLGTYGGSDPAFSETGKWYCFTFSYDSTQSTWADALKIYTNGQLRGAAYLGTPQTLKTSRSILPGLGNWRGRLSQISFYNRNLTSDEVLQNYNTSKSRFGLI